MFIVMSNLSMEFQVSQCIVMKVKPVAAWKVGIIPNMWYALENDWHLIIEWIKTCKTTGLIFTLTKLYELPNSTYEKLNLNWNQTCFICPASTIY